jgi:hypothetical protein
MGLMRLRVLENSVFILCVIWEASVLTEQLPASQGSAVGWMTKESSIFSGKENFPLVF